MVTVMHEWVDSLARGKVGEAELDTVMSQWFDIEDSSEEEDRKLGIDRWLTPKAYPNRFSVQYKTDDMAATTGNAFIEVVSSDNRRTPGWSLTCHAKVILYYVPPCRTVYWFAPGFIRMWLPYWTTVYPMRSAQNNGYETRGLLVPIHVVNDKANCGPPMFIKKLTA